MLLNMQTTQLIKMRAKSQLQHSENAWLNDTAYNVADMADMKL